MKSSLKIAIATASLAIGFVSVPAMAGIETRGGGQQTTTYNAQGQATGGSETTFQRDDAGVYDNGRSQVGSDGVLRNPVNRVIYEEPGRRGLYQAQTVATYGNVALSVVGLLAQLVQPRQQQVQQPAAQQQGLAECSADGRPSGVYVNNSDGNGLARCNAIFNR